jgi:hypothetical protein
MLRTQYVVVEHDGVWKIRFEGRHFGPYPNERAAVHAAIEAAERAPKSGYEPRVMTQSPRTGELLVEWTRGEPHPVDMPRAPDTSRKTAGSEQDSQSRRRAG